MKKGIKISLAVSVFLVLLGAVIFIIGMSVLGWDFKRLDATEYTARSFAVREDTSVTRVVIDVASFPVEVVKGDAVSLEYYDATNSEVTVECADGVLTVREKYDFNPFVTGFFNIGRMDRKYKLTIADGMDAVTLDGVNANIEFDGITIGELAVRTTNTDISVISSNIGTFEVRSTNLTLCVKNSELGGMTVNGTNVGAEIENVECPKMRIDATNLDFDASGAHIDELSSDATNNNTELRDSACTKLDITGTNGDYELHDVAVDTAVLHATNLDAELRIVGIASEYTVITTGRNMPPQRIGSTDKSITLSGTNNDASLVFVER